MPYNPALVTPMREEMTRMELASSPPPPTWTARWATRGGRCSSS